jgi:subtilisin family serine protease
MPLLGVDCFIMAVPNSRSTDAAASEISRDPAVSWSEPVTLYTAQSAPVPHEDALFPAQPAAGQWRLADVHARTTGQGVAVAVIDSGVDGHHPDLTGQIAFSRNFVEGPDRVESHGTAVAGVIAARADRQGIVGIAPDAHILALRACWQQGDSTLCDSLSLAKAVQFAVERRAPVINMSLSGAPSRLLASLLHIGLDRGATVVAAYDPGLADGGFPASLPGVVAVSDRADIAMARPVYVAPGRDVPAPLPGGRWSLVNGSSFAAAHVSGLFALLRSRPAGSFRLASARRGGGEIDMCATFGIDDCGAIRLAR